MFENKVKTCFFNNKDINADIILVVVFFISTIFCFFNKF